MACRRPGFVTGIKREAALIPSSHLVLCSGANSTGAEIAARRLADEGCGLLVSFGLAGGLKPGLAAGTLLAPREIVAPGGERYACAQDYHFPGAISDALAGSDTLLSTPQEKARLFDRTNAIAVDMESHAVAKVAAERNLPFLVLRAVADTSEMALPSFVAESTTPEGDTKLSAVILGLIRQPSALPDLLKLASASNQAFAALRRALQILL
jgi:adenosylhomocysteine nucleosidase